MTSLLVVPFLYQCSIFYTYSFVKPTVFTFHLSAFRFPVFRFPFSVSRFPFSVFRFPFPVFRFHL